MGLRIAALLPLLAAFGLSCQKEGKPRDEPGPGAAAAKPALVEAQPEQAAIPLDIWPANTSMMAGLDVAAIHASPMGHIFDAIVGGVSPGLLPSHSACQRRLLDSIDSMLFVQGLADPTSKSVVAIRGIQRSEVEACAPVEATAAAQKFGARYGALEDDLEKYLIWWHDDQTFLLSSNGGKEAIDLARPDKQGAPTNAALSTALAKVDTSAAIWIAAVDTLSGMSESIGEFRGSIQLKESLNASFRVQYDSADNASAAAKDTQSTLKSITPFAKYFEESRVRAEGSLLMFDLAMSASRVAEFANDPSFKGMFPPPETTPQ